MTTPLQSLGIIFYRVETYYSVTSGVDYLSLDYIKYHAVKETPKGYWIIQGAPSYIGYPPDIKKHFILKDARKKFAYETEELAMHSFIIRREKYIQKLENNLRRSKKFLEMAKKNKLQDQSPNFSRFIIDWG